MFFAGGETVTVIRPATRDRVGDPGAATTYTIDGCGIAQTSTIGVSNAQQSAVSDHRQSVVTAVELMCPPGADIRAGDKVRLPNGKTYLVDGQHWQPHNPFTGWEPGVVVKLKGTSDAQ